MLSTMNTPHMNGENGRSQVPGPDTPLGAPVGGELPETELDIRRPSEPADHDRQRTQLDPSHPTGEVHHPTGDPRHPTSTGPASVEESVYEEADYAGQSGPDASDPPRAAGKHEPEVKRGHTSPELSPGADLDPDEAADVFETRREAERIKDARDDRQDENIVSLDSPD